MSETELKQDIIVAVADVFIISLLNLSLARSTLFSYSLCMMSRRVASASSAENDSPSWHFPIPTGVKLNFFPFQTKDYTTGFGNRMTHRIWIRGQQWLHWLVLPSAALFSISGREFSCRTRYNFPPSSMHVEHFPGSYFTEEK